MFALLRSRSSQRPTCRLALHLPFHLDDLGAVETVFERWRTHRAAADKRLLDLWAYCFVYRHVLAGSTCGATTDAADVERAVASLFKRFQRDLHRATDIGDLVASLRARSRQVRALGTRRPAKRRRTHQWRPIAQWL